MNKKFAFTLAEVLITLGVIGVVAALTMPALIAKYQKKVLLARVKKTYSTFTNAVNLALAETGSPDNIAVVFDTSNTSLETAKKKKKYFNGAILCSTASDRSDTWPFYYIKSQNASKNQVTGESEYKNVDTMSAPYLKLTDGSCIKFTQSKSCTTEREGQRCKTDSSGKVISNSEGTDCEYESYTWTDDRCAWVTIDINGIKKPNQYGTDVYQIGIHGNGRLNQVTGYGKLNTILSNDKI